MPDQHKNFAYGVVLTAPSPAASGTSLTLGLGQGALFPAAPFNATVWPIGEDPLSTNAEIVRVTGVVGDVLTIVRIQESTSARTILVGDQFANTITVKVLTDVEGDVATETAARIAKDDLLSQAVSVVSTAVSAETAARVIAVNTVSNNLSILSQAVSVVDTALSLRIDTASALASAADLHASTASLAATSADAHANAASGAATSADGHANTASAAATSVNARVNSVNVFLSGISALSVGGVSTHGLQSVINALSNRISGVTGGFGSVTSAEAQAISAQAASAINVASLAATSADAHANAASGAATSVLNFVQGVSVRTSVTGATSVKGLQSVVNALSNQTSDLATSIRQLSLDAVANDASVSAVIKADIASVSAAIRLDEASHIASTSATIKADIASVSAVLATSIQTASAAATSVDSRVNSVNTFISGLSVLSVGGVSTHGLQSVLNALSNRISAGGGTGSVTSAEVQTASAAATSADAHAAAASLAATSVLNFVQGVSVRTSVGGATSVKGLQSVINALSNQTSDLATSLRQVSLDFIANDASVSAVIKADIASVSAAIMADAASHLASTSATIKTDINSVSAAIMADVASHLASTSALIKTDIASVSAAIRLDEASHIASTSATIKADIASVSAVLAGSIQTASAAATSVDSRVNSVNTFISGISARSTGGVSTHGLQSVINALSNRITSGATSVTSNELSDALNVSITFDFSIDGLQSVVSEIKNQLDGIYSALSKLGSVSARTSANVSVGGLGGLQSVIDALSNKIVQTNSAVINASTVGSIAALSLAISNDASVSAVIKADINSVSAAIIGNVSAQFGQGQFRVVTGAQAVVSTFPQKVSGLSLSLGANGVYDIHGQIIWTQSAGASASATFAFGMSANQPPAQAAFKMIANVTGVSASIQAAAIQFAGVGAICATPSIMYSIKISVASAVPVNMMFFDGMLIGNATPGLLKVLVGASTTTNTGINVLAGSFIRAFKIG